MGKLGANGRNDAGGFVPRRNIDNRGTSLNTKARIIVEGGNGKHHGNAHCFSEGPNICRISHHISDNRSSTIFEDGRN